MIASAAVACIGIGIYTCTAANRLATCRARFYTFAGGRIACRSRAAHRCRALVVMRSAVVVIIFLTPIVVEMIGRITRFVDTIATRTFYRCTVANVRGCTRLIASAAMTCIGIGIHTCAAANRLAACRTRFYTFACGGIACRSRAAHRCRALVVMRAAVVVIIFLAAIVIKMIGRITRLGDTIATRTFYRSTVANVRGCTCFATPTAVAHIFRKIYTRICTKIWIIPVITGFPAGATVTCRRSIGGGRTCSPVYPFAFAAGLRRRVVTLHGIIFTNTTIIFCCIARNTVACLAGLIFTIGTAFHLTNFIC